MSPTTFDDLDRRERRRLVLLSAGRIVVTTVVLLILYVLLPEVGRSGDGAVIGLFIGLIVFAGLMVWQIRTIVAAEHPELRAIEAIAIAVPVLIFVFALRTCRCIEPTTRTSHSRWITSARRTSRSR
jgi:hypothetical protein